jgi:hypothetical protein
MLSLYDALNCPWLKLYHWSSCFEENLIWADSNMYLTDVKSHPRCVHHRLEKVFNQLEPKWINETLTNLTAGVYNAESVAMHWWWINDDCQVFFWRFHKKVFLCKHRKCCVLKSWWNINECCRYGYQGVMFKQVYTRRHRARDVRRAQEARLGARPASRGRPPAVARRETRKYITYFG